MLSRYKASPVSLSFRRAPHALRRSSPHNSSPYRRGVARVVGWAEVTRASPRAGPSVNLRVRAWPSVNVRVRAEPSAKARVRAKPLVNVRVRVGRCRKGVGPYGALGNSAFQSESSRGSGSSAPSSGPSLLSCPGPSPAHRTSKRPPNRGGGTLQGAEPARGVEVEEVGWGYLAEVGDEGVEAGGAEFGGPAVADLLEELGRAIEGVQAVWGELD